MTTILQRQQSPSPSSRSLTFGDRISALGAKLTRSMSREGSGKRVDYDNESIDEVGTLKTPERSTSRGREAFHSSGRGGLGNIRQASQSRDARPDSGPDDFSVTRGREPVSQHNNAPLFSTGRGGAGNIRSPSRGPPNKIAEETEQNVIREHLAKQEDGITSTGRGGLGNLAQRSRSRGPGNATTTTTGSPGNRSRSRGPDAVFSTGRGGAGNIRAGDGEIANVIDEEDRRKLGSVDGGFHSTGRGGRANLSSTPAPAVESLPHTHSEYASTGRGGAGNIRS